MLHRIHRVVIPLAFLGLFSPRVVAQDFDSHRRSNQVVILRSDWTVGVIDGPDNYMFGRIMDIAVGESAIYVVDPLFKRVQVFDFSGHYVRTIGREGWGPGEYQAPVRLALSAGHLVVHDLQKHLYVVFDTTGAVLHTVAAESHGSEFTRMHADTAGHFFDFRDLYDSVSEIPFLFRIALYDVNAPRDTIRLPRVERDRFTVRSGGFAGHYPQPFMADLHWAVLPDGSIVFADGSRSEVVFLRPHGVERTLPLPSAPVRISADQKRHERERVEARLKTLEYVGLDPTPYIRRIRMPDFYPPVLGLGSDPQGRIWVRVPHPRGGENVRYKVVDQTGTLSATYDILPDDGVTLDHFTIAHDRIIVSAQYPDGIHRVRSYPLP